AGHRDVLMWPGCSSCPETLPVILRTYFIRYALRDLNIRRLSPLALTRCAPLRAVPRPAPSRLGPRVRGTVVPDDLRSGRHARRAGGVRGERRSAGTDRGPPHRAGRTGGPRALACRPSGFCTGAHALTG